LKKELQIIQSIGIFLETAHPIKFWTLEPDFKRKITDSAQIESVMVKKSKH
jgi:hypothetical protein